MKTALLIFLLALSLIASQKENARKIPSYIIDAKNYGLLDAKQAFFVIGSPKYGTMKENFAFVKKEDADEYVKKHGGCVVDYKTYVKMDDKAVDEYVKKHGVVLKKKEIKEKIDTNTTKTIEKNTPKSDIYNKENMKKYKF